MATHENFEFAGYKLQPEDQQCQLDGYNCSSLTEIAETVTMDTLNDTTPEEAKPYCPYWGTPQCRKAGGAALDLLTEESGDA